MKTPSNSAHLFRGMTSAKRRDLIEKLRSGEIGHAEARHIAVSDILSTLPPDLLPAIADLAKIPEGQRAGFRICVVDTLFDCWEMQEGVDTELDWRENESFARAIEALKSARQALAHMDESLRQALFWQVAKAEKGIDDFLTAFGELEPKRPLQRGKPRGKVKDPVSHKFVFRLIECASLHGGNLTFDKNVKEGTLVEALNELMPYLPEGVDPDKLSPTTLQRIKDAALARHGR
jgi:hypothetical protein